LKFSRSWQKRIATVFLIGLGLITGLTIQQLDSTSSNPSPLARSVRSTPTIDTPDSEAQAIAEREDADIARLEDELRSRGWREVKGIAPDLEVIDLSPAALGAKEKQLQKQMMTNSFSGESLEKLRDLLTAASEPDTRLMAIEAMGRSVDPQAKGLLIESYSDLINDQEKSTAISYLTPANLDSDTARFLFDEASNPTASLDLREMATFNLAMVDLALNPDSAGPSAKLLSRLPKPMRKQAKNLAERISRGVAHDHSHHQPDDE
jgi:hypothetical protein